MSTRLPLIGTVLLTCVSAFAAAPIATISASDPVTVDGRTVATNAMESLPIAVGTELATSSGPALLLFPDGSSVKVAPASRVKLTGSEALPKLVLLGGSLDYKLVLGSMLSVTSLDLERRKPAAGQSVVLPKLVGTPRADDITLIKD